MSRFRVGDRVVYTVGLTFYEGTVKQVTKDTAPHSRPDDEYYVLYKIMPDNPFRRTHWYRGEEVKGFA